MKYFKIFVLGFILTQSMAQADRGFGIIQLTTPEETRLDIKFVNFFSLDPEEESALQALSNKQTLFTYDWLEQKNDSGQPLKRKIGSLDITVNVHKRGQGGANGSTESIVLTVEKGNLKVLDQVRFITKGSTEISIVESKNIVFIREVNEEFQHNYRIELNTAKTIKDYNDLKNNLKKTN